jgi:hypothetical protein
MSHDQRIEEFELIAQKITIVNAFPTSREFHFSNGFMNAISNSLRTDAEIGD